MRKACSPRFGLYLSPEAGGNTTEAPKDPLKGTKLENFQDSTLPGQIESQLKAVDTSTQKQVEELKATVPHTPLELKAATEKADFLGQLTSIFRGLRDSVDTKLKAEITDAKIANTIEVLRNTLAQIKAQPKEQIDAQGKKTIDSNTLDTDLLKTQMISALSPKLNTLNFGVSEDALKADPAFLKNRATLVEWIGKGMSGPLALENVSIQGEIQKEKNKVDTEYCLKDANFQRLFEESQTKLESAYITVFTKLLNNPKDTALKQALTAEKWPLHDPKAMEERLRKGLETKTQSLKDYFAGPTMADALRKDPTGAAARDRFLEQNILYGAPAIVMRGINFGSAVLGNKPEILDNNGFLEEFRNAYNTLMKPTATEQKTAPNQSTTKEQNTNPSTKPLDLNKPLDELLSPKELAYFEEVILPTFKEEKGIWQVDKVNDFITKKFGITLKKDGGLNPDFIKLRQKLLTLNNPG